MSDIQTNLSRRIIEIRKNRGFSQQEVADLTDLKRSTIANIERGDQRPSIDFLVKFSQITGISLDNLAGQHINTASEIEQLIGKFASDSRLDASQLEAINRVRLYIRQLEERNEELQTKYTQALEEIKEIHQTLVKQFKIKP
ncbi:MAG: helix-turn-helix transcriptional regulator [Cyclobacteriaceae bacterium]